jgi:hypothetical protein
MASSEYASDALRLSVRCFVTDAYRFEGLVVTLTLYGVRPNALADPASSSLASLLACVAGTALANAAHHDDIRRTVT